MSNRDSNKGDGIDRRDFLKRSGQAAIGTTVLSAMGTMSGTAQAATNIADLPLTELAKRIQSGRLTATSLTNIYLDRIAKYDGKAGLNAYITVGREQALKRAAELDAMAKNGKFAGPLHGLPIAVKDNLDTADMPTTGGSSFLNKWTPPKDSFAVAKLREAGAIILGKTNMHEFAFGITTNNPHWGPARNPYKKDCIPGGSSGGSGAAVAAALCAGAIGTDTGGSVRIPAALCGVVGLKGTLGRVGRSGMMYLSNTRDCVGPLTRTVADAALMLDALTGYDGGDYESVAKQPAPVAMSAKGDLSGKRFGLPKNYFLDNISADTRKAMDSAIAEIVKRGGIIEEVTVDHMDIATPTGFNIVLTEAVHLMEEYLRGFDPQGTIDKYLAQMGPDVAGALGSQKGGKASKPVPGYVYAQSMRNDRPKMIAGFNKALANVDVLILPTTPLPASKIGEDGETDLNGKKVSTFMSFIRNCDPISVAGLPAITIPGGYSSDGRPIGIQMVTKPWREQKLISLAYAFEQATKLRTPPNL